MLQRLILHLLFKVASIAILSCLSFASQVDHDLSSRVRDAIDSLGLQLVSLELLLIDCLEVAGQALSLNGVRLGHVLGYTLGAVGVHEAEILECFRVSRREVEVGWDVAAQPVTKLR